MTLLSATSNLKESRRYTMSLNHEENLSKVHLVARCTLASSPGSQSFQQRVMLKRSGSLGMMPSHNGLVTQEIDYIKVKILLLCILVADVVNGIVTEALCIANKDLPWASISFGIVIPLSICFVGGGIIILRHCICVHVDCIHYGSKCISLTIKACTLIGGTFYFFGDNLHKVYDRSGKAYFTTLSLPFLVVGYLIYRVIPHALKNLQRYFKDGSNRYKTSIFNWNPPNDNETHSLIVAYVYLLPIVIDFDVALTIVQRSVNSCSNNDTQCNQSIIQALEGLTILSFLFVEVIIVTLFIIKCCRPHSKNSPFKLILPTRPEESCVGYIVWDTVMSVAVAIAVVTYLIADNQHSLDCYRPEYKPEAIRRIGCLSFSFTVFSTVIVGFLLRQVFRCAQVKGDLVSVKVLSDDLLEVYFQETTALCIFTYKSVIYTLKYNIPTSEITDSGCNHHELYRNDIEDFVKCLGWIGKLVAVNIQENQIVAVRKVDEKLYIVVHNTNSEPVRTKVYPVIDQEEEIQDFRQGTLTVMYNQDNHLCSMYLQEDGYAVQVENPSDDADYDSWNIRPGEIVLRVLKDRSGLSHSKYDPKKGAFIDVLVDRHESVTQV